MGDQPSARNTAGVPKRADA